jgi:hypothetical protein
VSKVNGRVPIVIGIGGNNTAEVIKSFGKFDLSKVVAILSVTPYYNIFTPNLNPSIYDYTINYPPEFKTNAGKAWLASKVKQCQSYNNNIVPQEPQDCPDSSFTFANNIARFVPTSSTNDLNYSGCIQLNVNSNYCYNDQFGNYLPNVEVLNHRSA